MNAQQRLSRLLATNGVPIALILVVAVVVFQVLSPSFLEPDSLRDYLNTAIPIILITVGVAFVIVGGGIDLSVGTVAGLSAGTTMLALVNGMPTVVGILVGLATGAFAGFVNGFLVTRLGISDFVVTLVTLNVAEGLLIVLSQIVPLQGVSTPGFAELVGGGVLGIPNSVLIAVVIFAVMQLLLKRTIFGRRVFAVGTSAQASNFAGVNVPRVQLGTFMVSGTLAGCAGVLIASRLGAVQAYLGLGYEFIAIAGAVLGGVSLAGGRGSVWAAVVGGLLLATLQQGLILNGVDPTFFSIVTALCIIGGVVLDRRVQQLAQRRTTRPDRPQGPPSEPDADRSDRSHQERVSTTERESV